MKLVSIREFRDHATIMFRSKEAILVTNRGHLSGLYFPAPAKTLPLELKREALRELVSTFHWKGVKPKEEDKVLNNFLDSRKNRR